MGARREERRDRPLTREEDNVHSQTFPVEPEESSPQSAVPRHSRSGQRTAGFAIAVTLLVASLASSTFLLTDFGVDSETLALVRVFTPLILGLLSTVVAMASGRLVFGVLAGFLSVAYPMALIMVMTLVAGP